MNYFRVKAFLSTGHTAEFECNRIVQTVTNGKDPHVSFFGYAGWNEWIPLQIVGSSVRVEAFTHEIVWAEDCVGAPSTNCRAVCLVYADGGLGRDSTMWVSHPCREYMNKFDKKEMNGWLQWDWPVSGYVEYGPDALYDQQIREWLKEQAE